MQKKPQLLRPNTFTGYASLCFTLPWSWPFSCFRRNCCLWSSGSAGRGWAYLVPNLMMTLYGWDAMHHICHDQIGRKTVSGFSFIELILLPILLFSKYIYFSPTLVKWVTNLVNIITNISSAFVDMYIFYVANSQISFTLYLL